MIIIYESDCTEVRELSWTIYVMSDLKIIPTFEEIEKRTPPYSAWDLWENPQLGALNYLNDALVLRSAKEEIQHGVRVGLKWVSEQHLETTS